MLRIKATKTSLYRLVQQKTAKTLWVKLPPMRKVRFWKALRQPDYFLDWYGEGYSYRAFLAAVGGSPLLTIERYGEGEQDNRQVIRLTLEELREQGMIEYIPERKRFI